MSTGLQPNLLNDAFLPWFFEAETWSREESEWESVELMFGVSRGMVDLIARACLLVSKIKTAGKVVQEKPLSQKDVDSESGRPSGHTGTEPFVLRLPSRFTSRAGSPHHSIPMLPEPHISVDLQIDINNSTHASLPSSHVQDYSMDMRSEPHALIDSDPILEAQANDLIAEINAWEEATTFMHLHPRCVYGNHAHRYAMRIHLLLNIFGTSRDDPRIIKAADSILELAKELLAFSGRITWFTWPVIVAGLTFPRGSIKRDHVLELLGEFG